MTAYQISSGPVALAASTTKTVVDLAVPATSMGTIFKWWVASDATSAGTATSGLRVQVGYFDLAVTTHTAVTPAAFDPMGFFLASSITAGIATTVEGAGVPRTGGTNGGIEEHPLGLTQSELIVWEPQQGALRNSSFWRIRVISPANIGATNIYAGVAWNE